MSWDIAVLYFTDKAEPKNTYEKKQLLGSSQ